MAWITGFPMLYLAERDYEIDALKPMRCVQVTKKRMMRQDKGYRSKFRKVDLHANYGSTLERDEN